MKTALSIAGSDSSGGAGIQADLKAMTMNGVFAMTAITALTAQNTTGVQGIFEVTPEFLARQLDAVFTDIRPDAVKIGMVSSPALIETIGERLRHYRAENIVLDPVMVATSGARLIQPQAVETLTRVLMPLALLTTPNIPEAELLAGCPIDSPAAMERAATIIHDRYGCAVLLKGGHRVNDANDLLCWDEGHPVVYGPAHRKPQHPRHRLHAFQRHRRQPGQGLSPGRVGGAGQRVPDRCAGRHAGPGSGQRPHESRLDAPGQICPGGRITRRRAGPGPAAGQAFSRPEYQGGTIP